MVCPRCQRENAERDRFCGACGAPLTPDASAPNPERPTTARPDAPRRAGSACAVAGIALLVGCAAALGFLAIILYPLYVHTQDRGPRGTCLAKQRALISAMLTYAADYDGMLPAAGAWVSRTAPYMTEPLPFRCPDDRTGDSHSYAFNKSLDGVRLSRVLAPERVVCVFDSDAPGECPVGGLLEVARRHPGGSYIAGFADGHSEMVIKQLRIPAVFSPDLRPADWGQPPPVRPR